MRAVYESKTPYLSIGYWDVNSVVPVQGYKYRDGKYVGKGQVVGVRVELPELESQRSRSYCFCEGEKHNRLTITEPEEIYHMREWVKCHTNSIETPVKEVLSEDVPEDLGVYIRNLKTMETEPQKQEQAGYKKENSTDEWDRKMEKRMRM